MSSSKERRGGQGPSGHDEESNPPPIQSKEEEHAATERLPSKDIEEKKKRSIHENKLEIYPTTGGEQRTPSHDSSLLEVHPDIEPALLVPRPKEIDTDVEKGLNKTRSIILAHEHKLEIHPTTEPGGKQRTPSQDSSSLEIHPDIEPFCTAVQGDNNKGRDNDVVSNSNTGQETNPNLAQRDRHQRPSPHDDNNLENGNNNNTEQTSAPYMVNNAFCILTAEEQRRQRLQNLPLIVDARPDTSPRDLSSSNQQEQRKIENRRLAILFVLSAIVLVIILVPSLLLTNHNEKNTNEGVNAPSPSPSASQIIPSTSPSTSLVPSFFPTTSSPTSTAFDLVVKLVGLDPDDISLDPSNYVFRSIQWMTDIDQITRSTLLRQQQRQGSLLVQRFALISLYYATEGESWTDRLNFLNPLTSECQWRVFGRDQVLGRIGVTTIRCVDNVVTSIALNDNNLGGFLPNEIGLLTRLTALELQDNAIGGTLPSSLSQLSQLGFLLLHRNRLAGSIPTELTSLDNLRALWLYLNDFTGTIPESIGDLTNLVWLSLWNNFLTGSIPSSIQRMTMLEVLGFTGQDN